MHTLRRIALAAAWLALGACAGTPANQPLVTGGIRVLFVGNSLTYVNDLPATVAAIAASGGDTIRASMAAGPNLALIDHLGGATDALDQLRGGAWDFVVLQQGPTTAGICRDSLVLWTTMFATHARDAGAKTAVLMSWAGVTHQDLFDEVRVSFEAASHSVGGVFVPAGEAWRAVMRSGASPSLYGPDGFHPSEAGTFLTALVLYERLTGHDARALPAQGYAGGRVIAIPAETVRAFQRAAHEANALFGPDALPTAEELARPSLYVSTHAGC